MNKFTSRIPTNIKNENVRLFVMLSSENTLPIVMKLCTHVLGGTCVHELF